jgi:conjugative relaxase-like TrwC/TraI family protein
MLSIGKVGMSAGQQMYYEEQVAAGREDYYAGNGEAPGSWTGSGARALGLSRELDAEQLKSLMDGRHPATGEQLAKRSTRSTMAAIDMTFSAPKSVSVLFAIGDERLAAALVEAHEEAVDAALGYLEREACRVRRGHNGTREEWERNDPRGRERARSEPAGGFVAAAYRHRMSRAQDPQLHTHVVAANMARGADGRWTALDARHIYEHAKAGGSVYQAHLRAAVRERMPWASWAPVRNGMAELEQVPPAVLHEFSTRRRRILEREEELVAAGVAVGDHGRERIAFDTREVKREVNEPDWHAEVRARAAEHGLGQEQLDELAALPARDAPEQIDERELSSRLFGASGLTATANTFGHRDVIAAVAAAAAQGLDVLGVEAVSQRLLASDELVEIPASGGRRFTTRELLEAEAGIVGMAVTGEGKGVATVGELEALMAVSAGERLLSAEQEQLVLAIAGSGNRIDTVEALAGTGKTTSAQALRAVYERAGYKVLGAAPTGRAVRELKEQAGIADSRTLDGWLLKLENDPDALRSTARDQDPTSPKRPVLIIDEAGMASRASQRDCWRRPLRPMRR